MTKKGGAVISLLLPTRQRPHHLIRLAQSVLDTADEPDEIELVTYIDEDDSSYDRLPIQVQWTIVRGPRQIDGKVNISVMWNMCWEQAKGEYFMHCGDDIVFRSKGWDTKIKEAIDSHAGKIAFVWGNDATPESQRNVFGTHGFVHKNWTDIIGRFVPPYFVSDYNDTWFNDVARMLNVAHYLPEVWTEHMHYSVGKAEIDQNTKDRLERHGQDNPEKIYANTLPERQEEAEKLRKFINESLET